MEDRESLADIIVFRLPLRVVREAPWAVGLVSVCSPAPFLVALLAYARAEQVPLNLFTWNVLQPVALSLILTVGAVFVFVFGLTIVAVSVLDWLSKRAKPTRRLSRWSSREHFAEGVFFLACLAVIMTTGLATYSAPVVGALLRSLGAGGGDVATFQAVGPVPRELQAGAPHSESDLVSTKPLGILLMLGDRVAVREACSVDATTLFLLPLDSIRARTSGSDSHCDV